MVFAGAALAGAALDPGPGTSRGEGTGMSPGRAGSLTFRILDAHGDTVRGSQTEQARRMHLIVVRRDLRRYQHLHPEQGPGGAWTTALTLPEAGVYRAFADFRIAGAQHTLGIDLLAPGPFAPKELPPAASTARVDGYVVSLDDAREPGTYRLFLQFRHAGRVHTAAFTRVVAP